MFSNSYNLHSLIGFHTFATKWAHVFNKEDASARVAFQGSQAMTDGKVVILSNLAAGTVLTQHQHDVLMGELEHEVGHLASSAFPEIGLVSKPIEKTLLNLFEDIRIENVRIKALPGAQRHLDRLCFYVDQRSEAQKREAGVKKETVFSLIYREAWAKYRNIDTKTVKGWLGDFEAYEPIEEAMKALPACGSTRDCRLLAEHVAKLIPPAEEEKQNEEKTRQQSHSKEGSGTPSQSQRDRPKDDQAQPGDPGSESDNRDGGNSTEGEPSDLSDLSDLDTQAIQALAASERQNALEDLIKEIQAFNNELGEDKTKSTQIPYKERGVSLPPVDPSLDRIFVPGHEDMTQFLQTRAEISAYATSLKKQLRIYLQTRSKKSWALGLEEGEVDHDRLFSVALGSKTIFKAKHERTIVNTAVELMLDLSASMSERITRAAGILLAEALANIPQLKLSITGFTTNGAVADLNPKLGRRYGMDILVFKDYDEGYLKARPRLGGIDTHGNTPLGDAYGKALERILTRKEPRRILWLVTDGEPSYLAGPYSPHNEYATMRLVKNKAKKLGIETLGLGIDSKAAEPYVEKFAYIKEISELPTSLMQILKGVVK